jgi:hypothetical protein
VDDAGTTGFATTRSGARTGASRGVVSLERRLAVSDEIAIDRGAADEEPLGRWRVDHRRAPVGDGRQARPAAARPSRRAAAYSAANVRSMLGGSHRHLATGESNRPLMNSSSIHAGSTAPIPLAR